MGKDRAGANGKDIVLKVPVGTQVYEEDGETLLADLTDELRRGIAALARELQRPQQRAADRRRRRASRDRRPGRAARSLVANAPIAWTAAARSDVVGCAASCASLGERVALPRLIGLDRADRAGAHRDRQLARARRARAGSA